MSTPKGMRDFPPDVAALRKSVFSRIESVFERFGFEPLETPLLEKWETLANKYGGETEDQLIYRFKDQWSGRELALRYDLTVPLARFVSENRDLPLPFKRYAIGRVYRHEQPQKGRYREFYQCDVDIVGSDRPAADAEVLLVIGAVMDEFRLPGYTVKVNDRRLLKGIFRQGLGIERNLEEVYRAIDKRDKRGWTGVEDILKKIIPKSKVRVIKDVLDLRGDTKEVLDEVTAMFPKVESLKDTTEELQRVLDLAKGVRTQLDLSMVRGLDYYTGPIFETVVKEPKIGSITGGGRYDGLLAKYGRDLAATGTTIGIERLIDAGMELGLFKLDRPVVDVYVVDIQAQDYAWRVASAFRSEGLRVRVDLRDRGWGKQMEEAEKLGARFVALVGPKEKAKGTVTLVDKERDSKEIKKLLDCVDHIRNAVVA